MNTHSNNLKCVGLLLLLLSVQQLSAYYDPGVQRWINRDPVEEAGGVNLFAFAGGNPISTVDAFGQCAIAIPIAGIVGEGLGLGAIMGAAGAAGIVPNPDPGNFKTTYETTRIGMNLFLELWLWTKSWHHDSPNPDKTGRRGDHKNRPDGKRDKDPQPENKPPPKEPVDDWWNRPPWDDIPPKDLCPPRA